VFALVEGGTEFGTAMGLLEIGAMECLWFVFIG
jgi:hypothetical protein